jgi:hypothetical protein
MSTGKVFIINGALRYLFHHTASGGSILINAPRQDDLQLTFTVQIKLRRFEFLLNAQFRSAIYFANHRR